MKKNPRQKLLALRVLGQKFAMGKGRISIFMYTFHRRQDFPFLDFQNVR